MRVAPGIRALWLSVAEETIDFLPYPSGAQLPVLYRRGEDLIVELEVYRPRKHRCPDAFLGSIWLWAPPISGGAAILPLSLFSRVLLAPSRTA